MESLVERNRQRGEKLIGEIERRKTRIRREFYEIGVGLRELS